MNQINQSTQPLGALVSRQNIYLRGEKPSNEGVKCKVKQ
jgi:hypothetical protein